MRAIGLAVVIVVVAAAGAGYLLWPRAADRAAGFKAIGDDPALVARGEGIYRDHCAACHGVDLEGQPNWRTRLPSGRLPAPPHDETGHTWHHSDEVLFGIVKHGVAEFSGLTDYESDMPAFKDVLTDGEIRAVLAYIKSRWPETIRQRQGQMNR